MKTKNIERFTVTEWRNLPGTNGREKIRARYGFHYIKGNSRPYFSITADIVTRERIAYENTHRIDGKIYWDCGGGCCHDDIARAFPKLAPLIAWHLSDDTGSPSHYVENALYWLRKHLGVFRLFSHSKPEGRRPGEPEPLDAFKRTIVFGSVDGDDSIDGDESEFHKHIIARETNGDTADNIIDAVREWLNVRLPRLDRKMRETMVSFGVEYIQPDEYRSNDASL